MKKKSPDFDQSLFRQVAVAEFNLGQERSDSPIRVVDRNDNGVVDEDDDFGGADVSYQLHRMCMGVRPYEADDEYDRLGLSWWQGGLGTRFMAVEIDRRAQDVMKRYRKVGPDLFDFGQARDLGLHLFMGTGRHADWIHTLRTQEGSLLGREFRQRTAILVEGGFDRTLDGCNFNTIVKFEGAWGFRRNVLKVTFRNATGEHHEFWNLRTGWIRVSK